MNSHVYANNQKKTQMPPKIAKFGDADKLTPAQKKQKKLDNKAKSNPDLAAKHKAKSDAKRQRRADSGSVKKLG
jgi:hypothetical protein